MMRVIDRRTARHDPDPVEARWLRGAKHRLGNDNLFFRSKPIPGGGRKLSLYDITRSGTPYLVLTFENERGYPRHPHEKDIWTLQSRAGRVRVAGREIPTNGRKGAGREITTKIEDHNDGLRKKEQAAKQDDTLRSVKDKAMWHTGNHKAFDLDNSMLPGDSSG